MLLARGSSIGVQEEEVLVTGGGDGAIVLWALNETKPGSLGFISRLHNGRDEPESVLAMSLDEGLLYSGRAGGELNVWHLDTRQLVRTMKPFRCDILSLSIGRGIVFVSAENGEVKVSLKVDEMPFHC